MNTHIRDNQLFLRANHGARAKHSTTHSITTSTDTALAFDSEDFDSDAIHNNVTNNSRLTIPSGLDGYWNLHAQNGWGGNATGVRRIWLRKNGVTGLGGAQTTPAAANIITVEIEAIVSLVAGDYVETMVFQASGGNLSTNDAGLSVGTQTFFEATYLGS